MANGYSAGNLFLNIDSVADNTLKNLDAVIDRLNIINNNLGSINKSSKLSEISVPKAKSTSKTNNFFKNFLRLGRWTAILYTAKRIGSELANIVTAGSDFGETLNLWQVAMGEEFLPQATEFVNKLNEAYGISKKTLMNSQAIFKNMLGSLGQISSQTAYELSEGITQMALDYASLYNVTFEEAMTKFQAALAGQVRPIRSVAGYDITENTLFQLYQELGGTKTMRQLTQTEKRLFSIYAIFQQMDRSDATGDLKNTIHMFANQSKVFRDSWKDLLTYAGLTVTRLLESNKVMQYLNAGLIFFARLLEGTAHKLDNGLGNTGDAFGDTEDSINSTTQAVERLQSTLLDFDKFRALDESENSGLDIEIDKTIIDALKSYDSILEDAKLEARALADSWLRMLGLVDENNDGILDIDGAIDKIKQKLDEIDFGKWGATLSNVITDAFNSASDWLTSTETMKSFAQDVADVLSEINWGDLIIGSLNLASNLAGAIADFTVTLLTSLDWIKLAKEILFRPLEYLLIELGIIDMLMDASWVIQGTKVYDWLFETYKHYRDKYGTTNWSDYYYNDVYGTQTLPDNKDLKMHSNATSGLSESFYTTPTGYANSSSVAQATYSGTMKALNDWWGGTSAKNDIPQLESANPVGLYQAVSGVARQYGKEFSRI